MRLPEFTTTLSRFAFAGCATALLAVGAAACGGGESSSFSEAAQRGKAESLARCASCHGAQGQGGVGPSWIDLAGSERVLKVDGGATTTVIADDAYLLRSILEPGVEEVDGFTLKMPSNGLTLEQANDVVAYIKELTSDSQN